MTTVSAPEVSASDLPFMAAFPTPELGQWRAAVDKVLKGGDFEKRLVSRSADGLRIEPLYPAAAPLARQLRGETGRWRVTARLDHPDPAHARDLALADLEGGADALALSFAGAPAARGYGLRADDVAALDRALDGVMLELIRLRIDPLPQGAEKALLLAQLVAERRLAPARTQIDFGLDPIGSFAASGAAPHSWNACGRQLAETIRQLQRQGFRGPFVTVDLRPCHEAGASEAQELGIAMATAIAYLRLLEAEGFSLAEARDALSFLLVADTDEFLTIAKFRAARLLWARIQEACSLTPSSMVLHAETAWRSLTRRDPWVNMLRATVATFSAGIGGADSLTVLPFTAALGLPDAFARRVARNTQLVLLEESHLAKVADPAAGSGGFEALTEALCEQGWAAMQALERQAQSGLRGVVAALASGALQAQLEEAWQRRARAVATRREPITGTSEYPNLQEGAVTVLDAAPAGNAPAADNPLALPSRRLAEPFEALRAKAEACAGGRPVVFLATLGPVADFTARAGFARNLFEAGGLAAPVGDGFAAGDGTDSAALVSAFTASGARLACLCGTDAAYAAEGAEVARALRQAGADIWLAGRPGESEAGLREAGVSEFIYAGCDAVAVLERALSIAQPT